MPLKSILLDTNLLCLLVVGLVGDHAIARHKRLSAYGVTEFKLLLATLSRGSSVVLTPQIFAETSNLIRQTSEPLRSQASLQLAHLAKNFTELNQPTSAAVDRREYVRLGVTDSVILMLNAQDCVLLTDDLDLFLAASTAGYPVVNFNYVRDGAADPGDQLQ